MTMILINDELKPAKNQDASHITDDKRSNGGGSRSVKKRKHSTSNQLDPYTSLSKQKTTVSARLNNHNSQRQSQNSSLVQSNLNNLSKDKVSQSYTVSNFHSIQNADKQNTMNNSGMQLSYFPNPEQIKNERESLERIHTFSLKEPSEDQEETMQSLGINNDLKTNTGNILDPLLNGPATERQNRNEGVGGNSKQNLSMESPFPGGNRARGISEGSRNSSTTSNRSCSHYLPDKVQIFQK